MPIAGGRNTVHTNGATEVLVYHYMKICSFGAIPYTRDQRTEIVSSISILKLWCKLPCMKVLNSPLLTLDTSPTTTLPTAVFTSKFCLIMRLHGPGGLLRRACWIASLAIGVQAGEPSLPLPLRQIHQFSNPIHIP